MVQDVASASHEQFAGMAQITKAMSQVDQLTQRNASVSEELSSTAGQLASQAEALERLIAFFRLSWTEDARPAKPRSRPAHEDPVHPALLAKSLAAAQHSRFHVR